jgi:hypothetical protein
MQRILFATGVVAIGLLAGSMPVATQAPGAGGPGAGPGTDLDAFMRQVLAKRDDNWKKLQQYVLDDRESIDLKGPGKVQLWGERRDYTWFIRDGFFVRSPVRVNGVAVGEADRRKYESDYLERQRRRDKRGDNARTEDHPPASSVQPATDELPATRDVEIDGLLRQAREPEFVRAAYFLRFRFEEGRYALVGRETINGREMLKIEHYPTNLFRGSERRRGQPDKYDGKKDVEVRRLMNKTSLVTLWVEPQAHQIVKYDFNNVSMDFLPAQWLARMDEFHAGMTMSEAFPGIWLPRTLDFDAALTSAMGEFELAFRLDFHDYRQPDVTSKITIPKSR